MIFGMSSNDINKNNNSSQEQTSSQEKTSSQDNLGQVIKQIFTDSETGGLKVPKSIYNEMDENNKKATDVWQQEGQAAAIKHMFTDEKTGATLSYSEMRSRYG